MEKLIRDAQGKFQKLILEQLQGIEQMKRKRYQLIIK